MAGSAVTQLNVKVGVSGLDKLPKLSASLNRLGVDTVKAGTNTKKLSLNLKEWEKTTVTSISRNQQLSAAWKELAANVQFGSNRFKEATAEAKRLDAELAKMQGRKGGGMGRMARTAGAVAGAGVFGGPEGAIGAAIGGLMPGGGPISAAVGGAIGAQVGMVRQAIGSTAEYSAALSRQRKALRLVINDTNAYTKSQAFLEQKSKKLAIPQDVIVRQFTSLTASVKGAGHSVEDAQKVFESIASGIRGTGGSLEDMKAAMRATSQVFSKGKVSAEELRQQLGERLPGAFTIFAESMGKTPAELDKALEQGKVTLDDFMKFSETLFKKYGKNAEILAAGPEAAGDRLAASMSELKDNIGKLLTPIGAGFQDTFKDIVDAINPAIKKLVEFQNKLKIGKLDDEMKRLQSIIDSGRIRTGGPFNRRTVDLNRNFDITKGPLKTPLMLLEERLNGLKKEKKLLLGIEDETNNVANAQSDVNKKLRVTTELTKKVGETIRAGIVDTIESAITGAKSLNEVLNGVLRSIGRMYLQSAVNQIPLPFLNAKGNVYAQNGIVPFAKGGIVSQPTIFPFKNGIGLMGEAGPEAIMPLRRGTGGRLGVEASGAGVGNIVVNVDASGSSVEGDSGQAEELGLILGAAIQAEIVNQQRPGGLLA
jgi:tape measure domain-containing protein